jgi:hypothetical protein
VQALAVQFEVRRLGDLLSKELSYWEARSLGDSDPPLARHSAGLSRIREGLRQQYGASSVKHYRVRHRLSLSCLPYAFVRRQDRAHSMNSAARLNAPELACRVSIFL